MYYYHVSIICSNMSTFLNQPQPPGKMGWIQKVWASAAEELHPAYSHLMFVFRSFFIFQFNSVFACIFPLSKTNNKR